MSFIHSKPRRSKRLNNFANKEPTNLLVKSTGKMIVLAKKRKQWFCCILWDGRLKMV